MFEPELQAKDIEMVRVTDPSLDVLQADWVTFDPSGVLQILINLITNAIKFTASSDKRVITVSVAASREPPVANHMPGFEYIRTKSNNHAVTIGGDWGEGELLYLRFLVQDTGCGLTPEEVKVLFMRFSQASPRTHAQYGGSGLGLFICRQLAELHGGQIGVSSEAGEGSMFSFYVKARRSSPATANTGADLTSIERSLTDGGCHLVPVMPPRQDAAGGGARADPAGFDPTQLEVLVVEDNLVNQKVLVKQLKKFGIGVAVANDGLEALAFLDDTSYRRPHGGRRLSVVLMDLEMPNMDGLTCVRAIRRMEADGAVAGHVPVIAVTANVRDEQVLAAKHSGMDDVVSKPFRIPDLLKKVESLLGPTAAAATPGDGVPDSPMPDAN